MIHKITIKHFQAPPDIKNNTHSHRATPQRKLKSIGSGKFATNQFFKQFKWEIDAYPQPE